MSDGVIRVFVPLTYRKRNGRPRIVAPAVEPDFQTQRQDAHILRLLGQAWSWRRQLEAGATLVDISAKANFTDRYVSRVMKLAYLSPDVLERLLLWRTPPAVTVNDLFRISGVPWVEQAGDVFAGQGQLVWNAAGPAAGPGPINRQET